MDDEGGVVVPADGGGAFAVAVRVRAGESRKRWQKAKEPLHCSPQLPPPGIPPRNLTCSN